MIIDTFDWWFSFSCSGYSRTVKFLIENGSDIHAKNNDGDTPIVLAAQFRHNGSICFEVFQF